jgi:hypothetical protein
MYRPPDSTDPIQESFKLREESWLCAPAELLRCRSRAENALFRQRQTGIRGHLMILLLVSAIAGGIVTSALFWAKGGLAALALAPIGGSLAAGMAAAWLGMKAGRVAEQTMDLDEQIAALRAVAAHGRTLIEQDARRAAADAQAGSERAA